MAPVADVMFDGPTSLSYGRLWRCGTGEVGFRSQGVLETSPHDRTTGVFIFAGRPATGRRSVARGLAVLGLVVFASSMFGPARLAGAHAILERSTPPPGGTLTTSPKVVSLTYSENVTLVVGSLRVFDGAGKRVDQGDQRHGASGKVVQIDLKPNLSQGSYAVAWQIISADTHPVHGGYVFSVGSASSTKSLSGLLSTEQSPSLLAVGAVLRGLAYLLSFFAVGGAVFVAFVGDGRDRRRGVRRAMWVAGVGAVVFTVLELPQQAALATGLGAGSIFHSGVLSQVLDSGVMWTEIGVAVAAVMAVVAVSGAVSVWRRWMAVASVAVLMFAFDVSGHSTTTNPVWLTSLADAVHVGAASVWVGGLALLIWSLAHRRVSHGQDGDPEAAAAMVVRFSHVATVSIIAVVVAGVVLSFQLVGSIHGLFATTYGLLVLTKICSVALIGVFAAFNHFRLVPALEAKPDRSTAWRYLSRTMRAEAVGIVIILGVTGVLVDQIPSRTIAAEQSVFSGTAKLGSGTVNLVIDPARTGPTDMHLYLLDAQGRPNDHEQSVAIQLTEKTQNIGPLKAQIFKAGPGHFQANGPVFTIPGKWIVTVQVRVDEFTENDANLTVNIHS